MTHHNREQTKLREENEIHEVCAMNLMMMLICSKKMKYYSRFTRIPIFLKGFYRVKIIMMMMMMMMNLEFEN